MTGLLILIVMCKASQPRSIQPSTYHRQLSAGRRERQANVQVLPGNERVKFSRVRDEICTYGRQQLTPHRMSKIKRECRGQVKWTKGGGHFEGWLWGGGALVSTVRRSEESEIARELISRLVALRALH